MLTAEKLTSKRAVAANVKRQDGREAVVSIPDVSIPDRTSCTDAGKRTVPAASNRSAAHSAARRIVAGRNAAVLRARPHAASSSPPSAQVPVRAPAPGAAAVLLSVTRARAGGASVVI